MDAAAPISLAAVALGIFISRRIQAVRRWSSAPAVTLHQTRTAGSVPRTDLRELARLCQIQSAIVPKHSRGNPVRKEEKVAFRREDVPQAELAPPGFGAVPMTETLPQSPRAMCWHFFSSGLTEVPLGEKWLTRGAYHCHRTMGSQTRPKRTVHDFSAVKRGEGDAFPSSHLPRRDASHSGLAIGNKPIGPRPRAWPRTVVDARTC